jgi:FkbM family methyltransferase
MISLPLLANLLSRPVQSVCEVGVNAPDKCSVAAFIRAGARAVLVEPLPWLAKELREAFPAASVIEGVCADAPGTMRLYDRGEGSWIETVPEGGSPDEVKSKITRGSFEEKFVREVQAVTFDAIDPGDLDILCVDVEGAEWAVLSRMASRPAIVRAETHFCGSGYQNPFLKEMRARMAALGYEVLLEDVSDTVWISPRALS